MGALVPLGTVVVIFGLGSAVTRPATLPKPWSSVHKRRVAINVGCTVIACAATIALMVLFAAGHH